MISKFAFPGFVLLSGLAQAGPVWAHAHLKTATPPDRILVSSSTMPISLTFTEGLEAGYSTIAVTDQAGQLVPTTTAMVDAEDASKLYIVPTKPLAPGIYAVDWHVLAKDGHSTSGSYRFTVTP